MKKVNMSMDFIEKREILGNLNMAIHHIETMKDKLMGSDQTLNDWSAYNNGAINAVKSISEAQKKYLNWLEKENAKMDDVKTSHKP